MGNAYDLWSRESESDLTPVIHLKTYHVPVVGTACLMSDQAQLQALQRLPEEQIGMAFSPR
jgi:hypothetical protein